MTGPRIETITLDAECYRALESELGPLAAKLSIEQSLTGDIFDVREPGSDHHRVDLSAFNDLARQASQIVGTIMPHHLLDTLRCFTDPKLAHPILMIKGCPLGDISRTPLQYDSPSDSGIGGQFIAAICGLMNGKIVTLLNAISHSVDANGRSAPLGLHIDGHFAGQPNVAVLLCLRGAAGARTVFTTLDDVVTRLTEDHVRYLSEPILQSEGTQHAAIVNKHGRWHFHDLQQANQFYFSPESLLDPEAADALAYFTRLGASMLETEPGINMDSGDIIVFDNQIKSDGPYPGLLHGRSPFVDNRIPNQRRWVKALVFEV